MKPPLVVIDSESPGEAPDPVAAPQDMGTYFDALYASSDDPWSYRTSWYEARKRGLMLAMLDRKRYRCAFEPGCGNGELCAALARRCDSLLAADMHPRAVEAARQRLAGIPNVRVMQLTVPEAWPRASFELIVISELAYYLPEDQVAKLGRRVRRSLVHGGLLLACHWRHPFAGRRVPPERAHALLEKHTGLPCIATHAEADFLMQAWLRGSGSVASREGIA
ncbi:class I SAM-dependent methyltransferase [Cupriavidus sp. 2TAF22]|uniref:class I SAM-dependent methyltransferase n=1 Tax=unclassified Cupriavidus TaxID=2640874 RepID=UPI003F93F730